MRRDTFKIDFDRFPHQSKIYMSEVKKIMQYAYNHGYSVRMSNPSNGLIQFINGSGRFKLEFFTSTFTVCLIRNGKQTFHKKIAPDVIKGYLMDNA